MRLDYVGSGTDHNRITYSTSFTLSSLTRGGTQQNYQFHHWSCSLMQDHSLRAVPDSYLNCNSAKGLIVQW
jgi:hypothetical protein